MTPELFTVVVASLAQEDLIKRSPRGRKAAIVLNLIQSMNPGDFAMVAAVFNDLASQCIKATKKHKLPSSAKASLWSTFHQLRCSQTFRRSWNTVLEPHISHIQDLESSLCFQLLADRIIKASIHEIAEGLKAPSSPSSTRPLTTTEANGIRYMAGYVASKLLKKYRKVSKHQEVQLKRGLFVRVLRGMKAENQPGEPDTLLDYTRVWSELIDRGGLYHINDDVFELFENIEMTTRQHVNVKSVADDVPDKDLRMAIREDILKCMPVLCLWDKIAGVIPEVYEKYSIELLQIVSDLWITVRGHSFARDWNSKFQKKYKKGTRKEIKETIEED